MIIALRLLRTPLVVFWFLAQWPLTSAEANGMTIKGMPPTLPTGIGGNAWIIFLDGTIQRNTNRDFEEYLLHNKIPERSLVYLNSPGGNLLGGIELGRVIRKYGLSTDIGKHATKATRSEIEPGTCYSACAYAYLGGRFRYLQEGSLFGVHQFSSEQKGQSTESEAQIASAIILEHIRSMGINPSLFSLAVLADSAAIHQLDRRTLEYLDVVNNGVTRPVWSIESLDGKLYLKGERDTDVSGINKFILFCQNQKTLLIAIFDALQRDEELLMAPVHSVLVDGRIYTIHPRSTSIRNGWFNGLYELSAREINALRTARHVGIALRFTQQAPIFLGFEGMPIGDGAQKLVAFLNQCR